jgi:protein involved in polysaccharide export with SLBB domain
MNRRSVGRLAAQLATTLVAVVVVGIPCVSAQTGDTRRVQATRPELEALLVEIDQILNSPGYSGRLRAAKRSEAELVRQRLTEGDLQVGDQLNLFVTNEPNFSKTFGVAAGRVLVLPGLPEIPLRGILRSELQGYLTEKLKTYIREPEVRAETLIRLSIFGAVGSPGFYQVPAINLAGDAIMAAGGPSSNADPAKTVIRRAGVEIWTRDAFQEALIQGLTLDQLNLRAGDELFIGERSRKGLLSVIPMITGIASLGFLITRIF